MFGLLFGLSACLHEPDATAGAEKYAVFCASCHGEDGAAGVQVDGVEATDLGEVVPTLDDETLQAAIQDGYGAMPSQRLTNNETADVIAWLREVFGG